MPSLCLLFRILRTILRIVSHLLNRILSFAGSLVLQVACRRLLRQKLFATAQALTLGDPFSLYSRPLISLQVLTQGSAYAEPLSWHIITTLWLLVTVSNHSCAQLMLWKFLQVCLQLLSWFLIVGSGFQRPSTWRSAHWCQLCCLLVFSFFILHPPFIQCSYLGQCLLLGTLLSTPFIYSTSRLLLVSPFLRMSSLSHSIS